MNGHISDIRSGDVVIVNDDIEGKVMFCTPSNSYSDGFPSTEWPIDQYQGIMIEQNNGALIFFPISLIEDGEMQVIRVN